MRYHIWAEGCQMNVARSSVLSRALESLGLSATTDVNQADLIILHTGVVRQSA